MMNPPFFGVGLVLVLVPGAGRLAASPRPLLIVLCASPAIVSLPLSKGGEKMPHAEAQRRRGGRIQGWKKSEKKIMICVGDTQK
jgi:hypothetical protein